MDNVSIRDWTGWDDSERAEYIASWSKKHNERRPRYNTNLEEDPIPQWVLAKWIGSVKKDGSSRYLKSDFAALGYLSWWTALTTPKEKKRHVTDCDMCKQSFYSETRCNKKKNGYPAYLVCTYCYDWSIPRTRKDMAKVIKGSATLPAKSGKSFSKSWTSKYKSMSMNKKVYKGKGKGDRKENNDKGNDKRKNVHETDEEEKEHDDEQQGYIAKTTEVMKEAVHVAQSGVTGLLHGASEALKDMSPFGKRQN